VSAFPLNTVRLRQLLGKELRQTLRDPRAKPVLFIAPIIQLLIFGYAVTTDVRNTKTFVVDRDRSSDSRTLLGALTASGYFRITGVGERPADLTQALDHGDALIGIEIPRGFAADLGGGRQTSVQLLVDGSTANTANVALGYATRIISSYGLKQGAAAAARAGAALPSAGVDLRARAWYNPNLESRVYNVPGVIGLIVMLMSLMLTALAVVREREVGTLEQLMVSPLTPVELIVGKTLPSVLVAFMDLTLVTTVALLWFGIPFRGSVLVLVASSVLYILCGLGVGLLISTISKTQQEAFMSVFLFLFPAMILSGLMFPVENMPLAIQYFTLLDPIRHFLVIVRGVFLRGAGWSILYPQILTLLVMGVSVLGFAATRFRKTIG
jgi:ABC-2 type transport system permease protein